MSKENNQFNIDYAFPGLCSLCHTEIANFAGSHEVAVGVFRPVISSLKSNFRSRIVILSNGSQMTISLCDKCDAGFKPEDCGSLMDSEIKGWEEDAKIHIVNKGDIDKYVDKMSELSIEDIPSKSWSKQDKLKIGKPKGVKHGTSK